MTNFLMKTTQKYPKPFVKWVGGKRNLLRILMKYVPQSFLNMIVYEKEFPVSDGTTYFEPFVGGGAVFFELHKRQWLPDKICLSDKNVQLVEAYEVIKSQPQKLIDQLRVHASNHSFDYYYQIREDNNPTKNPIESTARFLYLNKTCFNGLYRENKQGEFNVPMGKYKDPNIVNEENIWAANKALQSVDVRFQDFELIAPSPDDFVYLDPPYYPIRESSFTKYSRFDFMDDEHIRLRDFLVSLPCKWMLTNSDTPFVRRLYGFDYGSKKEEKEMKGVSKINSKWFCVPVTAPRAVAAKTAARKRANELIIINYKEEK